MVTAAILAIIAPITATGTTAIDLIGAATAAITGAGIGAGEITIAVGMGMVIAVATTTGNQTAAREAGNSIFLLSGRLSVLVLAQDQHCPDQEENRDDAPEDDARIHPFRQQVTSGDGIAEFKSFVPNNLS
jgi:hypothetical protein